MLKFIPLLLLPTISLAQDSSFLSYDNQVNNNQEYIEWERVRGDTTFRMWCDDQRYIFDWLDVNNDDLLNKRDLGTFNEEEIIIWLDNFIDSNFSFWSPNHKKHFDKIEKFYSDVEKSSKEMKIVGNASKSIKDTFDKIGLSNTYSQNFFIEASRNEKSKISIIDEGFTDNGAKWVAIKSNINFKIHGNDKTTQTNLTMVFLIVRKTPSFINNSPYILLELGIE